ncbi:MAG: glucosyltransferase domain-containing protein [Proteobacteria bacterium]|nr:glucosyltransferase domain-containing protein [Pseudomonadota bacterium]
MAQNDNHHIVSTLSSVFAIKPNEEKLFCLGLLLSVISKGQALFNASYSIDDLIYKLIRYDFYNLRIGLREGRFTGPLLAWLEDALGTNLTHATTLSALTLMISMTITAIMVCRLWRTTDDFGLSSIIVALIVLHPYSTDLYTWKMSMLNGSLPFPIALGALLLAREDWRYFVPSVLFLVLALGIHQIPLQFITATLVLVVPFALRSEIKQQGEWIRMVIVTGTATILYWIIAHYVINIYGVAYGSLGRSRIILFDDPVLVWLRVKELFSMIILRDPLISDLTRLLLLFLTIVSILGLSFSLRERTTKGWKTGIILIICCVIAAFSGIILTVIPMSWIPVFRNMISLSLIWAAVAGFAYIVTNGKVRTVVICLVTMILFGFAGMDNEILTDQLRANARDWSMMTRIASDIEHLPEFSSIKRIQFIGTNPAPIQGLKTGIDLSYGWHPYGVTLSAFAVPWSEYPYNLYREVTGHVNMESATEEEKKQAEQRCSLLKWPEHDAVYRLGVLAVVCLGKPVNVIKGSFAK